MRFSTLIISLMRPIEASGVSITIVAVTMVAIKNSTRHAARIIVRVIYWFDLCELRHKSAI